MDESRIVHMHGTPWNGRPCTACGRRMTSGMVSTGNIGAVTCGLCMRTREYRQKVGLDLGDAYAAIVIETEDEAGMRSVSSFAGYFASKADALEEVATRIDKAAREGFDLMRLAVNFGGSNG